MAMERNCRKYDIAKAYLSQRSFLRFRSFSYRIAPGYDHITSAIGGAIAAANGADFLC